MTRSRWFVAGFLIGAMFVLMILAASKAHAQFAMCGERAKIVAQLASKYRETRQAVGLLSDQGAAELFVSAEGTWTMLVTLRTGKSCIIAAGHDWEASPDAFKAGQGI
jgi:CBS domain containing-hemolysin-like protein